MLRRGLGVGGWGLGKAIALGLLAFTTTEDALAKHRNQGAGLVIKVRVQDYAQVPQKTLVGAERVSAEILEGARIQVIWINCPAPECQEPFQPTDLGLRILSQSMAEGAPLNGDVFGFAMVSTDQRPSFLASVFYDRVKALADKLGYSQAARLGQVMAHEIGHLLLRSAGHSPFGIMRARLTREDLLRPLRFTPQQVELIRLDVSARLTAPNNPQ